MRVLLISPYFSPFIGVGALRMNSLYKYLVKQGVTVDVCRLHSSLYDEEMTEKESNGLCPDAIQVQMRVYKYGLFNFFAGMIAFRKTISECMINNHYDCVIISGGPFYTFPLTEYISKKWKVKTILDYRDLWAYYYSLDGARENTKGLAKKYWVYKHFEKKAVKYASKIVFVTEACGIFMMNCLKQTKEKSEVIYNGFDNSLLDDIPHVNVGHSSYTITVLGKMAYYSAQMCEEFFCAIKRLVDEGVDIRILHIGAKEQVVDSMINQYDLPRGVYINTGQLPYVSAMEKMNISDAFLLNYYDRTGYGTKIFDYIYWNRPIIGIMPFENALSDLLKRFKNGYMCTNRDEIYTCIRNLVETRQDCLVEDSNNIYAYSREFQNKRYYELIKELVN